jgi:hypothetical protein
MSSKAFTAKTFAFLHGVNTNTKLRASDLKVAMAWTWYFNEEEGGQARVGCKTVGDRIGLSESTVVRSLHRLEAHGHIRVVWGKQGRGHPNHVWMVVKPAPEQVSEAEKPAPAPTRKPAGVPRKPAAVQENLLKNHHIGGSKEPPNMEGERDSIVLAHDSTPPDRGAGADAPPRSFTQASQAAETYSEVRAIWQRPWCDDERVDRRAFERACEEGTPADILDAAKAWVAVADAPRFLPPLARWLDSKGWDRPPPQRARRTAAAPKDRHRHNGRKRDISAEFFKLGSMRHAFERSAAS